MKLDRVKITGLSAIALVALGTGIGLALNGGHANTPASPVVVKEVAATSSAKSSTPAPSPTKSVLAPTVAVKKPAASAREVAPVTDPTTPDPTSQAPAPVDTTPAAEPTTIYASGAGVVGDDGQTRPAAPPPIVKITPGEAVPNQTPDPTPTH